MTALPAEYTALEAQLNAPTRAARLDAVRQLAQGIAEGHIPTVVKTVEVNNHVHTCYSFSPHSPSSAAWHALRAGLQAVGIMDHDAVGGVEEMLEAGALLGIATTAGFELRVNFSGTTMAGRSLNGPGLHGIGYIAIHGIPAPQVARCAAFLRPIQDARNARNRAMVERLNAMLRAQGLTEVDFQRDVYAASMAAEGGAITERHILAALSRKFIDAYGQGPELVAFLEGTLGLQLAGKVRGFLGDATNPHYLYDLLGVLKSSYADEFFIHPNETECVNVREALAFAEEIGAISAYAYLGDVTESPTGDKKAEKFEDDFLDELMACLKSVGFRAVTYMPPRNTRAQLDRINALCEQHGFMQISGVDINSSRQVFTCPEILDPRFANLITATWALIGHEKLSAIAAGSGIFGARALALYPALAERLTRYAEIGQGLDLHAPTKLPAPVAALARPLLGAR
ncbi:MAG TPA: PHP domain-containing protein [Armatimonadota bacterium]